MIYIYIYICIKQLETCTLKISTLINCMMILEPRVADMMNFQNIERNDKWINK